SSPSPLPPAPPPPPPAPPALSILRCRPAHNHDVPLDRRFVSRRSGAADVSIRAVHQELCGRRCLSVHSPSGRQDGAHHRSQHRHRQGDGAGPGQKRGPCDHGVPEPDQGGQGDGQHPGRGARRPGGGPGAGPGRHLVHTGLRTEVPPRGEPAAHPDQQRGRDDVSLHEDHRRLRDADRGQPPGSLPVDLPADWPAEAQRSGAGGGRVVGGPQLRLDPLPRPAQPGQLQQRPGLLPEQASQRAVHPRASAQTQRYGRDGELAAPGHGELGADQTLHPDGHPVRGQLRLPEDPRGGSPDLGVLRRRRGAAHHLRQALQRLLPGLRSSSGAERGDGREAVGHQLRPPGHRVG
ncbi:hypothetical protein CRUP_004583, partial [Coryphaenoides rupestris]